MRYAVEDIGCTGNVLSRREFETYGETLYHAATHVCQGVALNVVNLNTQRCVASYDNQKHRIG